MKLFNWRYLPYFNIALGLLAWCLNKQFQVFCQPVWWALIVLILFVASLAFNGFWAKHLVTRLLSMLAQGMGVLICIYCSVFLFTDQLEGFKGIFGWLLICIIFILPLTPGWFLIQCLNNFKREDGRGRSFFMAGIVIPLIVQAFFILQYKEVSKKLSGIEIDPGNLHVIANALPRGYMAERIVGMHFKYHTRIDLNDGWRPPLHDPILNVCRWVTGISDPLEGLQWGGQPNARIELYKIMFPDIPVMERCSCANEESANYFSDPRLK